MARARLDKNHKPYTLWKHPLSVKFLASLVLNGAPAILAMRTIRAERGFSNLRCILAIQRIPRKKRLLNIRRIADVESNSKTINIHVIR